MGGKPSCNKYIYIYTLEMLEVESASEQHQNFLVQIYYTSSGRVAPDGSYVCQL